MEGRIALQAMVVLGRAGSWRWVPSTHRNVAKGALSGEPFSEARPSFGLRLKGHRAPFSRCLNRRASRSDSVFGAFRLSHPYACQYLYGHGSDLGGRTR